MLDNIEESFLRQQNFVSDASHELKTPIAVIQGYSNLLKRWGTEDKAVLSEGIDSICRESDNMRRIVEQLLLLARIGKMNMTVTQFDVCEELAALTDDYKLMDATHTFKYEGEKKIIFSTDINLLKETVRTLIDNAVKYTPAGGTIIVSCKLSDDNEAIISIQDNGIGIAKSDLPLIFDRFFRCDKVRGRESGSSGLGLTIAKSIVEMLGGKITVKSELGKGSMFTITLR
jgi:signal transduction histidine kinase